MKKVICEVIIAVAAYWAITSICESIDERRKTDQLIRTLEAIKADYNTK